MVAPPGGGPPPHAHPNTQKMFHVLEDEAEFKTEADKQIVSRDGFVNILLAEPYIVLRIRLKNMYDYFAELSLQVWKIYLEKLALLHCLANFCQFRN